MERHTNGRQQYSPPVTAGTHRNGRPQMKPYTWKGDATGMPEEEVQERLAAVRAALGSPHGVTADASPPDSPFAPAGEWYRELNDDGAVPGVAALAAVLTPPPVPRAPQRCRRCGYLKTRCACAGGAR